MANAERGEVEIRIGDEVFVGALDMNAIVTAETALDKGLNDIVDGIGRGRVGYITTLLWAALKRRHPTMTPGRVGELIEQHGLRAVGPAMALLMERSTVLTEEPAAGDDEGNAQQPAAA